MPIDGNFPENGLGCISPSGVTSNQLRSTTYGKHIQDRVSSDRADAAADVHWPLLWWAERDDARAGLGRSHELRLLLLLRQDRAGHVPRAAGHARATAAGVCSAGAPDAEDWYPDAKDLCDPDRVAECVRHGTESAARIGRRDPRNSGFAERRRTG